MLYFHQETAEADFKTYVQAEQWLIIAKDQVHLSVSQNKTGLPRQKRFHNGREILRKKAASC